MPDLQINNRDLTAWQGNTGLHHGGWLTDGTYPGVIMSSTSPYSSGAWWISPGIHDLRHVSPLSVKSDFHKIVTVTQTELLPRVTAIRTLMCHRLNPIDTETKWPPFRRRHFQVYFLNENFLILNKFSLKYVHYGLIDNMAALVHIMDWHLTGNRPLSEAMLVCLTDAYMRHSASMSFNHKWYACRSYVIT